MSEIKPGPLEDIKVGDLLVSVKRGADGWHHIGLLKQVVKVTPKRFVVNGMTYDKATGRGTSRYSGILVRPTPEILEQLEQVKVEQQQKRAEHDARTSTESYKLANSILSVSTEVLERLPVEKLREISDLLFGPAHIVECD